MFSVVKVNKKPRPRRGLWLYSKTEREGFEPSKPCGLQVFETCCFNHSHTSPIIPSPSGGPRVSISIIANITGFHVASLLGTPYLLCKKESTALALQANSSCSPAGAKKRLAWVMWSARRALMRQGIVLSVRLMQASTGSIAGKFSAVLVFSKRLKYKNGSTAFAESRYRREAGLYACVCRQTAMSGVLKNGLCKTRDPKAIPFRRAATYSAGAVPSECP